jgi:hypothetical protein
MILAEKLDEEGSMTSETFVRFSRDVSEKKEFEEKVGRVWSRSCWGQG